MKIIFSYFAGVLMGLSQMAMAQQTHNLVVTINQPPLLVANAGPDIDNADELEVTIGGSPSASGGSSPYNYSWTPADNLSNPLLANPVLDLVAAEQTYSLTVTDANGCSATDQLTVLVSIVSVEEWSRPITVYPNPASKRITLETNTSAEELFVFDNSGRLVMQQAITARQHLLDLSALQPGMYHLKVRQGKKLQNIKIIVQ